MKTIACSLVLGAVAATSAFGDPIFFDDFSGNALLPHWNEPTGQTWGHHVANGLLTVDMLPAPPNPHTSFSDARIWAEFPAHHGDFIATVRMGWDPGQHRAMSWTLASGGPVSRGVGGIGYREDAAQPQLHFSAPQAGTPIPAPAPGMHEFTMARTGSSMDFYVNQQLVATLPANAEPIGLIALDFLLFYPGQVFEPVHVDFINIIPSPSTGAVIFAACAAALRRRRPHAAW